MAITKKTSTNLLFISLSPFTYSFIEPSIMPETTIKL